MATRATAGRKPGRPRGPTPASPSRHPQRRHPGESRDPDTTPSRFEPERSAQGIPAFAGMTARRGRQTPPRSPRPVGGAEAGGDEDRGAGCARRDIGGVPRPRRVDRIVARGERHALGAAIGMFLVERAGALGADHEFRAVRVHLPRSSSLLRYHESFLIRSVSSRIKTSTSILCPRWLRSYSFALTRMAFVSILNFSCCSVRQFL